LNPSRTERIALRQSRGIVEIVFAWLLFSVLVAVLASSRGRSGFGFFLLAAIISPLLAVIVLLVMKDLKAEVVREDTRRDHERQLEAIRAIATPKEAGPAPAPSQVPAATSIADEIIKLAALRDQGILTSDEFAQQKAALLAMRVATAKVAPATPPSPQSPVPPPMPTGMCPNCFATIPLSVSVCPKCTASFGPESSLRVKPGVG
jgi:hypothetical protein